MQNLAKKKTTFSRDIQFISICFNINTNKCKILQKRKRLFREIFHLLVRFNINTSKCKILQKGKRLFCKILFHLLVYVSILILIIAKSCKKKTTFSQDIPFISTCFIILLNDFFNINTKSRFLFCQILHLLVLTMKHALINGISREKVVFFFARFCIY